VIDARLARRVGALLAVVLLAACSDAPEGTGSPGSVGPGVEGATSRSPVPAVRTLRVGLGRDPASLDPREVVDDEGELVVRALFEGLVVQDARGRAMPGGAEGWAIEDGGLTLRFTLREAAFHDGTPVTARHHADAILGVFDPDRVPAPRADLLASLRGATQLQSTEAQDASAGGSGGGSGGLPVVAPGAADGGSGEQRVRRGTSAEVLAAGGVEVVSSSELVLRLERPDPLLLAQLGDVAVVPLPELASVDPAAFAAQPIGNGPFRMLGPREAGGFIRLGAVAEHPRAPGVDAMVLQVYAGDGDREQRWSDLVAGRLHVTAIPPSRRTEAILLFGRASDAVRGPGLFDGTTSSTYAYGFGIDVEPYDDVRLRQAISASIDRENLARVLLGGSVEAATALIPPSLAILPEPCAHCRYDPDLARERFAAWSADGRTQRATPTITVTYPRGSGHVTVAETIAADIERTLRVPVRLQSLEFTNLARLGERGELGLFRFGVRPTLPGRAAVVDLLDPLFRGGADGNWTGWSEPTTDTDLDLLRRSFDPGVARRIEAELLEAAAVIPLLWTRHDVVVHPDVTGFLMDPSGRWWPELVRLP
jgi:oligopeptide transport system substrate-binding protein